MDSIVNRDRITVLDGATLVIGSAVASVHLLRVVHGGFSLAGWLLGCLTFLWLSVTATGPFLYITRRYIYRVPGYPGIGDRLWAWLGTPWILAAVLQSATTGTSPDRDTFFSITLAGGLVTASIICIVEVWSTWVAVSPEQAARIDGGPWTNRVGLALAIAWPIQCGLGMVIIS